MRFVLGLIAAASLSAADLGGIWIGQVTGRNGVVSDIAFQLEQTGTKLGGKLYGDYVSHPIVSGVVSGDLVTFVVLIPEQAGNEINDTRIRYTGSLANGQLELVREREASTRAGSGGGVKLNESKQRLILKRL